MIPDSPEFEVLLRARRQELVDTLRDADVELGGIRSARSDATSDDEHDPEGSTLSQDWSRIAGLRGDARIALDETDAALARLSDGTFGACANCGRPIAPDRLRARPATTLCIDCARRA